MKTVDEKNVTPLEFPGRTLTVLFSPANGSRQLTTAISKVPAGGMLPWHAHEGSDEIIYVMQGQGTASHESLEDPVDIYPGMTLLTKLMSLANASRAAFSRVILPAPTARASLSAIFWSSDPVPPDRPPGVPRSVPLNGSIANKKLCNKLDTERGEA